MNIQTFLTQGKPGDESLIEENALTYSSGVKVKADTEVYLRQTPPPGRWEKFVKLYHGGNFLVIQTHSQPNWVGEMITQDCLQ